MPLTMNSTMDVPVCNDLVDLSCDDSVDLQGEVKKEIKKEPSVES